MRFIHTADWHLGNQMHNIDRKLEFQFFLDYLKNQILEQDVSSLIISGDIFDTANPPVDARSLYYSFLASVAKETSCKNIIIIAGNHDSAALLEAPKELFNLQNIHVVGFVKPNESAPVFELFNKDGKADAICMAVPFMREVDLRSYIQKDHIENSEFYAETYKALYEKTFQKAQELKANRNIPIIATGHLYASGLEGRLSKAKSYEKSDDGVKILDVVGTLGTVPSSVFPQKIDYVALGHIHYSSMVEKNPKIRYSGSPFVLGFDEAEIPRTFLTVELTNDSLNVKKCVVPQYAIYKRIFGTLEEIQNALNDLNKINSEKPIYIELMYKKEIGVNAQEYLFDTIKSLKENISVVSWKIQEKEQIFQNNFEELDTEELKNLDDSSIFTELILSKTALAPESKEAKAVLEKFLPLFLQNAD